ncbi:hypothetical protein GCK32_019071, partial [Trichostrongylus colubriformis]
TTTTRTLISTCCSSEQGAICLSRSPCNSPQRLVVNVFEHRCLATENLNNAFVKNAAVLNYGSLLENGNQAEEHNEEVTCIECAKEPNNNKLKFDRVCIESHILCWILFASGQCFSVSYILEHGEAIFRSWTSLLTVVKNTTFAPNRAL